VCALGTIPSNADERGSWRKEFLQPTAKLEIRPESGSIAASQDNGARLYDGIEDSCQER